MTCAVMQPTYLPWLGYFDLISRSDIFVFYDSVQFEKQSWQQRNYIRNKEGRILLTIPVKGGIGLNKTIKEVEINNPDVVFKKHLKSIELAYKKSLNFQEIFPELADIYSKSYRYLFEINVELIKFGMKRLGIATKTIFASELDVEGKKVEALIDICKKLNANHYLSPLGAQGYIYENNLFLENNIELTFQSFDHPIYKQINYPDFMSHLSFIDYMLNCNL